MGPDQFKVDVTGVTSLFDGEGVAMCSRNHFKAVLSPVDNDKLAETKLMKNRLKVAHGFDALTWQQWQEVTAAEVETLLAIWKRVSAL